MNAFSQPSVDPGYEEAGGPAGARRPAGGLAEQFDLRRLANMFRRRIRLFAAIGALVFTAVVLITMTATPMYTATANVMLDVRQEQVVNAEAVLSGLPADSSVVDTEVEILRSRRLAERVVNALQLDKDPEFNPALRSQGLVATARGAVSGALSILRPSEVADTAIAEQKAQERIVDNVLAHLSVRRSGLTYVINVAFESESPSKAATIANKFAELYLLEQLEAKFDATEQANTWLNERLEGLRQQVLADEAAVQQYKIANNLLSAEGATLTEQEISNYNQSLSDARAEVAAAEARLSTARRQLAAGSTGDDLGEALSSAVIQQLRQQRATASARVADLQGRYGERHPEMLTARRQLTDIDAQIQAEIQRIISNLEAQVQVARQRAGSISGSLSSARGTLAGNNQAMVRLNELERTAEASRTLYESYLNRYKETSAQQGIEQSDARIVSQATIPTGQSSPRPVLNLALGLVLALGCGVAAVVLAEMLDAGLATAEDVEQRLEVSYLGAIPLLASVAEGRASSPIDYVVEKPLSSFAEAFRNLRASVIYSRLGESVKIVAVTSALPGEGKTTTSLCLARSAAQQGHRVMLVDCDLRRRSVNRLMGREPERGLIEVLAGEATLEEVLQTDSVTGVKLLPLAKSSLTPKDVFGSAAMDRLLDDLRRDYDMVILDTAPIL
ncbi:MAG: polysaccharide biosynthesis tyrosine autokinase, partial [Caulobacteraceae bacterium]|nr:polysaccharide biosynthesis tyrosine autokinase [Caulobacteraceae bacterium]